MSLYSKMAKIYFVLGSLTLFKNVWLCIFCAFCIFPVNQSVKNSKTQENKLNSAYIEY